MGRGIGDMAVVGRCRRKGIGKLLVNCILDWLKQKKCHLCGIEVKIDNPEAITFFKNWVLKRLKDYRSFIPVVKMHF